MVEKSYRRSIFFSGGLQYLFVKHAGVYVAFTNTGVPKPTLAASIFRLVTNLGSFDRTQWDQYASTKAVLYFGGHS